MRLLSDSPAEQSSLPPQEEAVRLQNRIDQLKIELETLTAKRDDAIKQALAGGIKVYGGYRFTEKAPASGISEAKLAATHPDAFDGYCEWYPMSREVKLTKTDLAKYLKLSGHTNPEQVIADCTEPGTGPKTYTLTKLKEGSE